MSSYVTLLGAENVERAASSISHSADQMQRAASEISFAMERFAGLVERLESLGGLTVKLETPPPPTAKWIITQVAEALGVSEEDCKRIMSAGANEANTQQQGSAL